MPRFAGDAIAPSKLGQVLAIAERLDTLAGGFAAGLKPTGNKDPFALRRNALGLARTLLEGGLDSMVLRDLVAPRRRSPAPVPPMRRAIATLDEICSSFVFDRLRAYYADRGVSRTAVRGGAAVAALVRLRRCRCPTSTVASTPSASSPSCPRPKRWPRPTSASATS